MAKRAPGSGTTEERNGRWWARLPLAYGRGRLGPVDSKAEAKELLAMALEKLAREDHPTTYSLRALCERSIAARKRYGYKSTRSDESLVNRLGHLADVDARDVTPQDIRQWLDGLRRKDGTPLAPSTLKSSLQAVRTAYRYGRESEGLECNPCRDVQVPKALTRGRSPEVRWLSLEEIDRLLEASSLPQRQRFAFAIYTGLRAGELWALRWCDINEERGLVLVRGAIGEQGKRNETTKNGKHRQVPILAPILAALSTMRRRDPEDRVFIGRAGPHTRGYDANLATALSRAGVRPARFHDLRHTCASHLAQGSWAPALVRETLPLESVRQWLGHSTIKTTERYAHLSPGGLLKSVTPAVTPEEKKMGATYANRTHDLRFTKPSRDPSPATVFPPSGVIPGVIIEKARAVLDAFASGDPSAERLAQELCSEVIASAPAASLEVVS